MVVVVVVVAVVLVLVVVVVVVTAAAVEMLIVIIIITHRYNTDSAVLQTARSLKTEVQKETRKMDNIKEKTKERWYGKRMH